jgi:coenzyme F420 hydrogenase subunit beta
MNIILKQTNVIDRSITNCTWIEIENLTPSYMAEEVFMPQIMGSSELLEDVHKRDLCIGCGACVELCPYFKNYKGKTAQLFPCTLEQGRCYAYCPKAEVNLDELTQTITNQPYDGSPLGSYIDVRAARAGEKLAKSTFQAGGIATALMTFALKTKRVEAVALTDRRGLTPVARLVTDWEEVAACATSKFMAAPTLSALNMAVREGYENIAVVGTPCQMVAVAQMRSNPMAKKEHEVPIAFSIGLFCNWSLDTRQLMDLLSEKMDLSEVRRMDIPPPPANIMIIETDNGRKEVSLSDIKPLIPHTCFICLDMTAELADVSLGMFEGRPGWNTLIIRSDKGAELVDQACKKGFVETKTFPEENLQHLSAAAAAKKDRSLRMLLRRELINNQGDQRAALRIPQKVVNKILKKP